MFRPEHFIRYPQREAARLSLLFMAGVLGVTACSKAHAANPQGGLPKPAATCPAVLPLTEQASDKATAQHLEPPPP